MTAKHQIDLNVPCPKCKGSTFNPDTEIDCSSCLGSGDLGQAIGFRLEESLRLGLRHDDAIVQAIARHLIQESQQRNPER